MANSDLQKAADRTPHAPAPQKPSAFWHTLKLVLKGRFADALEYSNDGDTEN